ncbi:hypothetical protein BX666DRAFT_204957 [Dichotomocladium elegans]|nr:hypothetical protein BX666DRAFT_204957 [Dichotomocladium elegans]
MRSPYQVNMLPYIKRNYNNFSISDCFRSSRLESRRVTENNFRRCISEILAKEVRVSEPVYAWAREAKEKGFQMLTSSEAEEFWDDLTVKKAKNAATSAQRKAAFRKLQYQAEIEEEVLNHGSIMRESPQRSKRKHSGTGKEGLDTENEETDNDVRSIKKVQRFHWLAGGGDYDEENESSNGSLCLSSKLGCIIPFTIYARGG